MRGMIVALVCLGAGGIAWSATPGGRPPSGASNSLQSSSTAYAQQILSVAQLIAERYVKPIPPAKIVEAALEGIYEAAREPMPTWVKADLSQASNPNQLLHILMVARQQLGDREALRDQRALSISLRDSARARSLLRDCRPKRSQDLRRIESHRRRTGI